MNVGLLFIATGKYWEFVQPLLESARRFFCVQHNVTAYVFTEPRGYIVAGKIGHISVEPVAQDCLGWPFSTLMRYHVFTRTAHLTAACDYLYYCDVDMRFNGPIGGEIFGDVVATKHPGFVNKSRDDYPYETRRQSAAFVPPGHGTAYYAGGFQGGTSACYLDISRQLAGCVDADLHVGIIAAWHDESHWNRYLALHPPTLVLEPTYCFPEKFIRSQPNAKLVALDKNHTEMRAK